MFSKIYSIHLILQEVEEPCCCTKCTRQKKGTHGPARNYSSKGRKRGKCHLFVF